MDHTYESTHLRAHIWEHTNESTAHIWEHTKPWKEMMHRLTRVTRAQCRIAPNNSPGNNIVLQQRLWIKSVGLSMFLSCFVWFEPVPIKMKQYFRGGWCHNWRWKCECLANSWIKWFPWTCLYDFWAASSHPEWSWVPGQKYWWNASSYFSGGALVSFRVKKQNWDLTTAMVATVQLLKIRKMLGGKLVCQVILLSSKLIRPVRMRQIRIIFLTFHVGHGRFPRFIIVAWEKRWFQIVFQAVWCPHLCL